MYCIELTTYDASSATVNLDFNKSSLMVITASYAKYNRIKNSVA